MVAERRQKYGQEKGKQERLGALAGHLLELTTLTPMSIKAGTMFFQHVVKIICHVKLQNTRGPV